MTQRNIMSRLGAGFAASAVALTLAGCKADTPPEAVTPTSNANFNFVVLFTRNGCEYGRFDDTRFSSSRTVYSVTCPAAPLTTMRTEHTESCGKNCTDNIDVVGASVPPVVEARPLRTVPLSQGCDGARIENVQGKAVLTLPATCNLAPR